MTDRPAYRDLPLLEEGSDYRHAWDYYPAGDNLGCLANLTPEARLGGLAAARDGVVVNVTLPLNLPDPPLFGREVYDHTIFSAGREALALIAGSVSAYDFFIGFQRRGIAVGVIYSPEEAFEDEHFRARGFQTEVTHEDLGRRFRYPGAPYQLPASPWRISRRAPKLGEHDREVLGEAPERKH